MSDPTTVIQKAEAHSPAYDTFLDGLAGVIGRAQQIWDLVDLMTGYWEAIAEFWLADQLTFHEYTELTDMIDEMRFGFEPAGIDFLEAA